MGRVQVADVASEAVMVQSAAPYFMVNALPVRSVEDENCNVSSLVVFVKLSTISFRAELVWKAQFVEQVDVSP